MLGKVATLILKSYIVAGFNVIYIDSASFSLKAFSTIAPVNALVAGVYFVFLFLIDLILKYLERLLSKQDVI
ncbi:MAG: hypothetical protein PF485_08090 [Bacteroidales bacterium]|nr:hypothetical protein [Bacteroidales bacterium]